MVDASFFNCHWISLYSLFSLSASANISKYSFQVFCKLEQEREMIFLMVSIIGDDGRNQHTNDVNAIIGNPSPCTLSCWQNVKCNDGRGPPLHNPLLQQQNFSLHPDPASPLSQSQAWPDHLLAMPASLLMNLFNKGWLASTLPLLARSPCLAMW